MTHLWRGFLKTPVIFLTSDWLSVLYSSTAGDVYQVHIGEQSTYVITLAVDQRSLTGDGINLLEDSRPEY